MFDRELAHLRDFMVVWVNPFCEDGHTVSEERLEEVQRAVVVLYLVYSCHNQARHIGAHKSVHFWVRLAHSFHIDLSTKYAIVGVPPERIEHMINSISTSTV